MMLIGSGGTGQVSEGGGSAGVTVWYGAAQNVPDALVINPAATDEAGDTTVSYRGRSLVTLLGAGSSLTTTAGAAVTATAFAASGFYKSTAGQAGSISGQTASTTTFLGGGGGGANTGNYGYTVSDNKTGFFQMQPIIVGVGSSASNSGTAGIGCGGGYNNLGGPGFVLIASW